MSENMRNTSAFRYRIQIATRAARRAATDGCLPAVLLLTLLMGPTDLLASGASPDDTQAAASKIIEAGRAGGGLIVHVGCADGQLTAALAAGDAWLVQGLATDPDDVQAARRRLLRLGRYGQVSVDRFDGRRLPYADNLVNLLVVGAGCSVDQDEQVRVLVPGGAAVTLDARLSVAGVQRKPWPAEIDQWSHFLHDATNNAVARDARVAPPRQLKWTCGPRWSRSHEFQSSLCAMVSANGRVFYVFDEGLTSITDPPIPERWTLVARDAFNGVLLWKRPMPRWGAEPWGSKALRSVPPAVPRSLVAEGDRVFVTLGYRGPVAVLDAATGTTRETYAQTDGAEELRVADGLLLLRQGRNRVVAIDTGTGKTRWEATGRIQPTTLAAADDRAFFQDGQVLRCLKLSDGKELWHAESEAAASLLVVHQRRVFLSGGRSLWAVSTETGKTLWTVPGRTRNEMFVANNRLWHWEGNRVVGRDVETGQLVATPDTRDVFSPGHHLRCYQGKATERFLITPFRGVEFVSTGEEPNTECDWIRGACRYGVMPANGLLYTSPTPCFCYPGVKLTGFLALSGEVSSDWGRASGVKKQEAGSGSREPGVAGRLERGPAYGLPPASATASASDWPTYRHDRRRSGATADAVAPAVAEQWRVQLAGRLTPPVAAGRRVYVAEKDRHTLFALGIEDGRKAWQFTASGRIDSPPTVYRDLVLFGAADGRVYCLRSSDGQLVWRFNAAPADRRIVSFGQLESPWRVHGSVLVEDGVVYGTAGRSSYLDGGIRVFGLQAETGKLLYETRLDTWSRTRTDAQDKPFIPAYHMEGTRSDILVSQNDAIYLGQYKFDRQLKQRDVPYVMPGADDRTVGMELADQPFVAPYLDANGQYERRQRQWLENTQKDLLAKLRERFGGYSLGQRQMGPHVLTTWGFLDDSWFNRTYWMYASTWPGYYIANRAAKTGQLLVVGPEKTYALQAFPTRNFQSPLFKPGEKGYLLLADRNDNEPVLDHRTRGTTKGWGYTRSEPPVWHQWIPIRIRGMVLAGNCLFAAGPPDRIDPDDPMASFEGRAGGALRALSADDGHTLAEYPLDAPPVFDGLIAASGRLILSSTDGRVISLAPASRAAQ